jgi:hypothetical protein
MEARMGEKRLVNKVPQLLAQRQMTERDFLGECLKRGVSIDTARRLLTGKVNTTTDTLAKIAGVLNVDSICEIIDLG